MQNRGPSTSAVNLAWYPRRDLNSRLPRPKRGALSTELRGLEPILTELESGYNYLLNVFAFLTIGV